jgi:hypothetical protein
MGRCLSHALPLDLRARLLDLADRLARLQPSSDPSRFSRHKSELVCALRQLAHEQPVQAGISRKPR